MSQIPRLCRWLLNAVAPVVPASLRCDWRREWHGELWHWIGARVAAGDPEASRAAFSHCLGAVSDAVHLRRADAPTRLAIRRITGHPATPISLAGLALMLVALLSGLEHTRQLSRPLPYSDPDQVIIVRQVKPFFGGRLGFPLSKVSNWDGAITLQSVAAYTGFRALVSSHGATDVSAAAVDGDFFRVLGVKPAAGQLFNELDWRNCTDCVVVSTRFWRDFLDSDPAAVGASYPIAGRRQRVVGILPAGFWFFSDTPDVFMLTRHAGFLDERSSLVYVVARMERHVEPELAAWEMRNLYRNLRPLVASRGNLEAVRMSELTHEPLYRWLTPLALLVLTVAGPLVWLLPQRRMRLRSVAHVIANLSAVTLVVGVLVVELVHSRATVVSGARGFGPETLSLWLVTVGIVMAITWAWHDRRRRCRTCLARLAMPVQMGSLGHVLMEAMSTEMVCPNGHGMLWTPEDSLESHPEDQWLRLDESWQELFPASHKH